MVVVQDSERPWWSILTNAYPSHNVFAEPFDRGSATGVVAALIAIAERAPNADVAVVFGSVSPARLVAFEDAWMEHRALESPEEGSIFVPGEGRGPLAFARSEAWLERAERVDRGRVAALRMALSRAEQPIDALDSIYPFLATLDLERELLGHPIDSANGPKSVSQSTAESVPVSPSALMSGIESPTVSRSTM